MNINDQPFHVALFSLGANISNFFDAINSNASPGNWPAIKLYASWGKIHRAIQVLDIVERSKEKGPNAKAADDLLAKYNTYFGYIQAIEDELRERLPPLLQEQWTDGLARWTKLLAVVRQEGLDDEGGPGSLDGLTGDRDFLEWTWRGCTLAKIDDSARLHGIDPAAMRKEVAVHDSDLLAILGNERPPNPLADEAMWWHIRGGQPYHPEGRR